MFIAQARWDGVPRTRAFGRRGTSLMSASSFTRPVVKSGRASRPTRGRIVAGTLAVSFNAAMGGEASGTRLSGIGPGGLMTRHRIVTGTRLQSVVGPDRNVPRYYTTHVGPGQSPQPDRLPGDEAQAEEQRTTREHLHAGRQPGRGGRHRVP